MGKKGLLAMRPKGLKASPNQEQSNWTRAWPTAPSSSAPLLLMSHGPLHMMYIPYFSNAFVQFSMLQQLGVQWTPF